MQDTIAVPERIKLDAALFGALVRSIARSKSDGANMACERLESLPRGYGRVVSKGLDELNQYDTENHLQMDRC